MDLCLGIDEELTETLWVKIKGRAGTSDIMVEVCYKPPYQEDQSDEALYRQIKIASCSQAMDLMVDGL